ncbi:MAG: 6-carboxytetrahydropterin synthase QueD [bacterium]
MYRIGIESKFSGAHRLRRYRGSCERLHGHNWNVRVELESDRVGKDGLVMDFRILKKKVKAVLKQMDHNYLNSLAIFKKQEPTAENIACKIFKDIKKKIAKDTAHVKSVRVHESNDSWAEYTGS